MKISVLLLLMVELSFSALPAGKIFEQNCLVCHQLENTKEPIVGPSLVEIAHFYKDDLAGFIKWCNAPGKKRSDAIEMPSMVHVGNDNLEKIHAWILNETKGKKFKLSEVKSGDPYGMDLKNASQPRLQRIFMADSSPASIAVTIDGQHSLCWDTVSCRMRYLWKGGFIDGYPYWRRNGNAFAKLMGEIYYRAPMKQRSGLVIVGITELPKFSGYNIVNGLPVFKYTIGTHNVTEAILNRGGSLVIKVSIENIEGEVKYPLGDLGEKVEFKYSAGKIQDGALVLLATEAADFELVFNLKK